MLVKVHSHKQSGIAMIEVLVTAIILAIGISGMGALLLSAIQATQDTSQQSQGLWIAQDFVNRIRSNPEGAKEGLYDTTGYIADCSDSSSVPMCASYIPSGSSTPVEATECSHTEIARYDLWSSQCSIDPDLHIFDSPADFLKDAKLASACVSWNSDNSECKAYSIQLSWKNVNDLSQFHTYSTRVETN